LAVRIQTPNLLLVSAIGPGGADSSHVRYCPPDVGAMLTSSAIDCSIVSCASFLSVHPPAYQNHEKHQAGHNCEHDYGASSTAIVQGEDYAHQRPWSGVAHCAWTSASVDGASSVSLHSQITAKAHRCKNLKRRCYRPVSTAKNAQR